MILLTTSKPFLREIISTDEYKKYPEVEHVHFFGFYIGNYPDLEEQKILALSELLNSID